MVRVGFIGLGRMGAPMCRYILKAGYSLTVFDTDPASIAALVEAGATGVDSPAEVGHSSQVVLMMVPTDQDVIDVASQVLTRLSSGGVIAICSSTTPGTCVELAARAAAQGAGIVDAPVARGVRGAEAGDLTVFAGGMVEHVDLCRPVFDCFAGQVFHMGPVGKGQVAKTVNNLIHWVEVVGIYEALRLGAALGLHPRNLRPALLAGSVESRTLRDLHLVGLAWPHKDMENAMAMAEASHTEMPLMEKVQELVVRMNKEQLQALFMDEATA